MKKTLATILLAGLVGFSSCIKQEAKINNDHFKFYQYGLFLDKYLEIKKTNNIIIEYRVYGDLLEKVSHVTKKAIIK